MSTTVTNSWTQNRFAGWLLCTGKAKLISGTCFGGFMCGEFGGKWCVIR